MEITEAEIIKIAQEIEHYGTKNVLAMHVAKNQDWADYILVATFVSSRQALGLIDEIRFLMRGYDIETRVSTRNSESTWFICDADVLIIHLMSAEARAFYDLERLSGDTPKLIYGQILK